MLAFKTFSRRVLFPSLIVFVLLTVTSPLARAGDPPLTSKLPSDCVAYLGWGGWQATADARAKTGLGELMSQPGLAKLASELDKWINSEGIDQAFRKERVPERLRPALKTVILTAWQRPWAVSLTKIDPAMTSGAPFEGVLVIDLGPQADEFAKAYATLLAACPMPMEDVDFQYLKGKEPATAQLKLIKKGEQGGPEALAGIAGQHFVLALGSSAIKNLKAVFIGNDKNLTDNPAFAAAAAKTCPGTSLLHFYADTTQLLPLAMTAAMADPKIGDVINVLGLDSLKSASLGVSYTGRNLTTALYFAGPPAGLSSLVDPEPVKDELLKFVPADACMLVALNVDRPAVMKKVKALLDKAQPGAGGKLDWFFEKVKQEFEIDVPGEVFPLLGKGVVLFDAPSSGGLLFGWQVAVECKSEADAAKLTEVLKKFVGKINGKLQENRPASRLDVTETTLFGQKLNLVNIASKEMPLPLAISWGQAGKVLIFGLFPQPVAETLARVSQPDPMGKTSILANPQYAALRKGHHESGSILFYGDATGMAKFLYPFGMAACSMGITYLRGAGADVSVADLPTQSQVLAAFSPSLGGVTTDQEGTTIQMTGPTGVFIPVMTSGDAAILPVMVAVLLPALSQARNQARAAQLEAIQRQMQIEKSIRLDNKDRGQQPPGESTELPAPKPVESTPPNRDLGFAENQPGKTLTVAHIEAVRDVLNAYAAGHQGSFPQDKKAILAADRAGQSPRLAGEAWSGPNLESTFAYIPKLKNTDPENMVLGYTVQKNERGQRLVLYLNGQIRLCTVEQLKTALERTQKYLIEQGR